jgi:glyoxylase-like metal-dependent hydrolase (beta-lactamase superfamily II)
MGPGPDIAAFFDEATNSVSYLVSDPATRAAAVIDPVLDFDPAIGCSKRTFMPTICRPRR